MHRPSGEFSPGQVTSLFLSQVANGPPSLTGAAFSDSSSRYPRPQPRRGSGPACRCRCYLNVPPGDPAAHRAPQVDRAQLDLEIHLHVSNSDFFVPPSLLFLHPADTLSVYYGSMTTEAVMFQRSRSSY